MCALAAALYGLLTLANGGLASNTELLVNLFVVLGVFALLAYRLDERVSVIGSLVAGASLGLAFQVNFLAGILVAGVAAFYLAWMSARAPFAAILPRWFANGTWMLLGFAGACVLVTLPIALWGNLADYPALKLAYLGGYPGIDQPGIALRRVAEAVLPYWPFWAVAFLLAASAVRAGRDRAPAWCAPASPRDSRLIGWLVLCVFSLLAAVASRRFYQHFFLFTAPSLVLLAATFLRMAAVPEGTRRFLALCALLFGAAAPISAQETFVHGIRAQWEVARGHPADAVAAAADYLSKRLRPGETIYVFDGQPVLYFLTRTTPPTRFAFPESHLRDDVTARFGTTPRDSVRGILDRRPRFVVAQQGPSGLGITPAGILLKETLDREYLPARAVDPGAPAYVYVRADVKPAAGNRN
jgi:hypothetical protein